MKKRQNTSARASAPQITVSVILISLSAVLLTLAAALGRNPLEQKPADAGTALHILHGGASAITLDSSRTATTSVPKNTEIGLKGVVASNFSENINATSGSAVTVLAADRGKPLYNFGDGRQMAVRFRAQDAVGRALQSGQAAPRALAATDLDGNATPDVVAGYSYGGIGIVTIQRGNPDAFAPTDESVYERMAQGYNPDALLPEVEVIQVPEAADFIELGDVNGDGQKDILVGARGGALWLLTSDGAGFSSPALVALPGKLTALAAGEFRAADGKLDVAVAVSGAGGAQLLIYDGATGGLTGKPMELPLAAEASVIRFGGMDEDPFQDLVVAAGSEIQIVHGWGRKQKLGIKSRVEHIPAGAQVRGLSLGHYIWDRAARLEIAALADDGTLQLIERNGLETSRYREAEMLTRTRGKLQAQALKGGKTVDVEAVPSWTQANETGWTASRTTGTAVAITANPRALLTTTNLNLGETEEVTVAASQSELKFIRQINSQEYARIGSNSPGFSVSGDLAQLSLETPAAAVAVLQLPPKLNGERDLVVLEAGTGAISIAPLAATTVAVDRFDDPVVTTAGSGAAACTAAANDCSLRGAVLFSNVAANSPTTINMPAGTYTLSINGTTDAGCGNPENGDLGINMSTNIVGLNTGAIIVQTGTGNANNGDRVICMDETFLTSLTNNFSNITIVGGRDGIEGMPNTGSSLGGAGIIGGELSNTLTLTNVTFVNNQAVRVGDANIGGGGIQITGGNLNVVNCTFGGTTAPGAYTNRTSLTNANSSTSSGAGLYWTPSAPQHMGGMGTLTVTGSMFNHNTSSGLGGGGADPEAFAFAAPGGTGTGTGSFATCTFQNNTAVRGAGMLVSTIPVTVATTTISNNSSNTSGGGIYNSGTLTLNGTNPSITFSGNTAPNGGTSVTTVGIVNVQGTNMTIGGSIEVSSNGTWTNSAGSVFNPTDVVIDGGTFNASSATVNISGNLSVGPVVGNVIPGHFNGDSATINIAGNLTTDSSSGTTFNGGTGTFNFNGSGAQSITGSLAPAFNNLTDSNITQPLTANTSFTVSGNLSINSGAIFDPVAAAVISGSGTLTGNGTARVRRTAATADFLNQYTITNKTLTNLTVEYIGAGAQTGSALTYGGLKINNASGVTLAGATTVNGALTLTSGTLATGANTLTMGASATRSRTSGYIIGNEKKIVSGNGSFTFDIGTANGYSPADATITAGTGDLTVVATQGANPNVVSSRSLQRYWTLTEGGALTTNLTFHYLDPTDLMGSESNYQVLQVTGTSRTYYTNNCPAPCVDTAANTLALSGVTDFSVFTGGEARADLQITSNSDSPDPVIAGNNITYTIGLTNNGPDTSTNVSVTDAVPASTTFVSATLPSGWSRSDSVIVGGTGNLVFTKASVASGETASFQVIVKVNTNAVGGSSVSNTATAASSVTTDPTPANNSLTASTLVYQPPVITSANNTTFTVGTNGSFSVTTTGFPTPSISRGGVALPSGVSFVDNANGTGTLSGIPATGTGGTYAITFTASNAAGTTSPQSFTLTVNEAPAITSANSTTFAVGSAGSFTVTTRGYPAPTVTETGSLPSGVGFDSPTRVLSGTPGAGTGGLYNISFKASNGIGTDATQNFALTVNQPPAITSGNSTTFTVGTAGSFNVTTTGYPPPAITETGALPGGVTLTSGGLLSGTPNADTDGSYPISLKASNGVGADAMQSFTLTVNPTTCTPPPANMISWWAGDGNASDLVGGHDGTLVGGAVANVAGKVANAFQFQGTTAEVDVPSSSVYDFGANAFTIDAWVKLNSVSGTDVFVAHDEGTGFLNKWIFWLNSGNLRLHYEGPAIGGAVDIGIPFAPTIGQWYHLAVTRSGSTYKFYVNGAQIGGDQTNVTNVPAANALLTLGKAESYNAINGYLDEIEIFNRALTTAELASMYYSGRFGKCDPPLQLSSAVSRKTQGAGTFDINLPLSGTAGIECRDPSGNHMLVFTFSNAVVSGNASVTGGVGSVSGSPGFAGKNMTVNLTGVTNAQQITVKLSGVTDAIAQVLPDTSVSMSVLLGDTTGDGSVNSADISQTKSKSGQTVDPTNFRNDVTVDGSLNSADISLVKSKSGTALP